MNYFTSSRSLLYLRTVGAILLAAAGCNRERSTPTASATQPARAASAPAIEPLQLLQGKWRLDNVQSGDPMVIGDHPWNIVDLTISGDSYTARRVMETVEQGRFTVVADTSPRKVLFYNWGHKDEPHQAIFDAGGDGVIRLCMFTKEEGPRNCLDSVPAQMGVPPPSDDAFQDTVLYTFTREQP